MTPGQVSELLRVVRERRDEIIERWRSHFPAEIANIDRFGIWILVGGERAFSVF